MNNQNENIDQAKKTKISNMTILRAVVAGYLFYLGFTILRDVLKGEPGSLPLWLLWLCGILFMLSAIAFGFYTWKYYQKEMASLRDESKEGEPEGEKQ